MRFWAAVGLLTFVSATAAAQTVETPVAFDSASRVQAVTPAVAERLRLSAPAWPVSGAYREARLYSISPGDGFVLVVHRPGGALERFLLSPSERARLASVVEVAMAASGRPTAELAADVVSEPAGNAFARHLTLLSAAVYGPLAASLANESAAGGALYLATTGLTYFVSYGAAQSNQFTRAQSDLAGDLGLAAATGGMLLGYAATGEAEKGVRFAALAAGFAGTVTGASLGKNLSDAEAHAATMGIETAAATAVTIAGIAGAEGRGVALAVALAGGLGYPIGVRYPRRASYNVTAGDIEATSTSALVGVAFAGATLGRDPSDRRTAATLGAGYLVGELVGDRLLARRFDLTQSQANVLKVGAFAGGLLGLALPVLAGSDDNSETLGAVALGATLGMAALAGSFPGTSAAVRSSAGGPGGRLKFTLSPMQLLGVATRARGVYPLARVSF